MTRIFVVVSLIIAVLGPAAAIPSTGQRLAVAVGSYRLITGSGINQVAVSNPAVADVQPLSTSELLITGLAPGSTEVYMWDKFGRHQYEITTVAPKPDAELFANTIRSTISIPGVTAEAVGDRVILYGEVQSQDEAKRAEATAKALYPKVDNLLTVKKGCSPSTLAAINEVLAQRGLKAAMTPDGKVLVTGEARDSGAVAQARKAVEPWAKEVEFVFDVKTAKSLQQESVDALSIVFAKWSVKASPLADGRVLLEGSVPDKDALDQVQAVVASWPKEMPLVSRVGIEGNTEKKQVLIRSRVVEIDRGHLKDLGVDWSRIVYSQTSGEMMQYSAEDQPFIIGQGSPGPFPIFGGPAIKQLDPIGARVDALIQDNNARVLAQPSLVTASGTPANILIGGEIPIPVPQAGVGTGAVITIQYKQFGISLDILPIVDENNEIAVTIKPEVSQLDYANGTSISGVLVPAFKTRRAQSTVHVASGESIAIGGLLSEEDIKNIKRIPLLSQIPILGNFFKSVSTQKKAADLIIIVTPELAPRPSAADVLNPSGPNLAPRDLGEPPNITTGMENLEAGP